MKVKQKYNFWHYLVIYIWTRNKFLTNAYINLLKPIFNWYMQDDRYKYGLKLHQFIKNFRSIIVLKSLQESELNIMPTKNIEFYWKCGGVFAGKSIMSV